MNRSELYKLPKDILIKIITEIDENYRKENTNIIELLKRFIHNQYKNHDSDIKDIIIDSLESEKDFNILFDILPDWINEDLYILFYYEISIEINKIIWKCSFPKKIKHEKPEIFIYIINRFKPPKLIELFKIINIETIEDVKNFKFDSLTEEQIIKTHKISLY